MLVVNVFEAKTTLSKLVEAIESGKESEVIIARHGTPVARLSPITRQPVHKRIGSPRGASTCRTILTDTTSEACRRFRSRSMDDRSRAGF